MTKAMAVQWITRRAFAPVALVAALGLCACGGVSSTAPTTSPTNGVAYLCQVLPRVDRLIVTRKVSRTQFHFTFPAAVTVTNAAAARRIASVACGLADMPKGVQACPVEFSIWYHLDFAVRGEKGMGGESIVANPTGCQTVTGLGAVRTTAQRQDFYQLLGNALGLRNAGRSTFAGTLQNPG
jgi:hypothetical protein